MDPPPQLPPSTTTITATTSSAAGVKLRLMCSYGGQIVPRPHDKALCYAGGETRIVAVDRRTTARSISAFMAHLSRTLLGGGSFCLKYQLPDHDLDSLVSVATDEDLTNMIDEYDRFALSSTSSRLRFFIFPVPKPESDYDARSEAWFFDSLRSSGIAVAEKRSSDSSSGGESEGKFGGGAVDSGPAPGPESIVLETNSSFGSTGSAASVSNLPAVRGGGGEEVGLFQVQDFKVNLPVMDSIGSDSSITSSNFQSPNVVYLDTLNQSDSRDSMVSSNLTEIKSNSSDISTQTDLLKPMHVYGYPLSQPMDQLKQQAPPYKPQPQPTQLPYLHPQPQFIHTASPYVTQYYPGAVPATPYPRTYQPYLYQQQHQQTTHAVNKPYPVYVMAFGQAQAHDMSMQCNNLTSATAIAPSHPQLHPKVVHDGFPPAQSTPEPAPKAYRSAPMASQPVTQMSHPLQTQPAPGSSAVEGASYGGGAAEYEDALDAQIYKTQPSAPAMTKAAMVMLSDNLNQLQLDNTKQQVRS